MSISTRLWRVASTVLVAASLAATTNAYATTPPPGDQADSVEVYERDVFVIVGSTLRNPDASTAPSAPLFNNAGVSLGLTWGKWQAPTATSVMRVANGYTRSDLHFTRLVPKGVYSVFWGTLQPDSENPHCRHVERTLPFVSTRSGQQPDASSFVAGPGGGAGYTGRVRGNLLAAGQVFLTLTYHFDGKTYNPLPNKGEFLTRDSTTCRSSFGEDAMRQLDILQKW
jgi:hypothetical protein